MSVRHEELRVVERSALRDDPLIGEGFHEGDDRVDLVGAQRRNSERHDDCAVEFLDRSDVAATAVQLDDFA